MIDEAVLHNELERLADIARHEIDASRGSVAERWSRDASEATAAITARLIRAGVEPELAQMATTAWIVLRGRPVLECLEKARAEHG